MANIPTVQGQTVAPARGPVAFQNVGDTRGAFGEAQAQATAAGAEALGAPADALAKAAVARAEADRRIASREDLILAANVEGAAKIELDRAMLDTLNSPDIELPSARVEKFRGKVTEILGATATKHAGGFQTAEGEANLRLSLNKMGSEYTRQAIEKGVEEGRRVLDTGADARIGELAQIVSGNPGALDDALGAWDDHVAAKYAPGFTQGEAEIKRRAGAEQLATMAVDHYNELGMPQQARAVLEQVQVRGLLTAPRQRELNLKITAAMVDQGKAERKTAAMVALVRKFEPGFKPDARFVLATQGITLPAPGKPTEWQTKLQIAAAGRGISVDELMTPAHRGTLDALLKIEADEKSVFANDARGRAQQYLLATTDAAGMTPLDHFRAGTLDPSETAIVEAQIRNSMTRHENGMTVMDPAISSALRARGLDPNLFANPLSEVGGLPPAAAPTTPAAAAPGAPGPGAILRSSDNQAQGLLGGKTLIEHVLTTRGMTGVGGAVQSMLGGTPLGLGGGSGELDTARQEGQLLIREITTALQKNNKYPVGEYDRIGERMQVDPSMWDDPQRLANRLVAVTSYVSDRVRDLEAAVRNPRLSQQDRNDAESMLATVKALLPKLAPIIIDEPDPAKQAALAKTLPVGTVVLLRDATGAWKLNRVKAKTTGGQK